MKHRPVAEWVYCRFLQLYPTDFRTRYGEEMLDVFRHRWVSEESRSPRWTGLRVWWFTVADVLPSLIDEWIRRWRTRREGAGSSPAGRLERIEDTWRDVTLALRGFARKPGFYALVVATLAVGTGATTAVFSVVNGVLFHPLGYREPDRLVQMWETWSGGGRGPVAYANVTDWRTQADAFQDIVAYQQGSANLQDSEVPERVRTVVADDALFDMLGVPPLLGRTFVPGEGAPGAAPVAVLSEPFWRRRFGADPGLVGKKLRLDGRDFTVVGIMPAGFRFPAGRPPPDLWLPLVRTPALTSMRASHDFGVVARLADGIDIGTARSQMDGIADRLSRLYPEDQAGGGVWVRPLREQVTAGVGTLLFALLGAVGLVLLIACANVANMLLARSAERRREAAIRLAMGGERRRILRQFLTESVLLSVVGGLVGILLAYWATRTLVMLGGDQIPRAAEIHIDRTVLFFVTLVAVGTGIAVGVVPALSVSKTAVASAFGGGNGRGGMTHRGRVFRDALVVGEFTMAFVLVVAAGLLVRTLVHLQEVDPGFVSKNVLTMRLSVPQGRYTARGVGDYLRAIRDRVAETPGVAQAGMISKLPLQGFDSSGRFAIDGQPWGPPGTEPYAEWRFVSPGYFGAMGIPVVRGRDFSSQDNAASQPVVLVNEALARHYYPNEDPIGKRISTPTSPELFTDPEHHFMTIVGIVADVRDLELRQQPRPEIYFDYRQVDHVAPVAEMSLVAKGLVPDLAGAVRSSVQKAAPEQPVYDVRWMKDVVSESVSGNQFVLWLFGSFAAMALVLALAGIYGVISYLVTQSTRDFGIQIALGAGPGDVLSKVMRKGMLLAGAGLAAGIAGTVAVTRILGGMLFGVKPTDGPTLVATSVLLIVAALVGCAIPARRALRVDPIQALRSE